MTDPSDFRTPVLTDVPNPSSTARPTKAHYYRLAGGSGAAVASLAVELDDEARALRGDLCFYGNLADRDGALRTAQNILAKRYADGGRLIPLDVYVRDPNLATIPIVQETGGAVFEDKRGFPLWIVVVATAVLFLVLALVAQLDNLSAPFAQDRGAVVAIRAATSTPPPEFEAAPAATGPASVPPNTNGLPPSRNADSRLAVGMTVVIDKGLRSFVRTEPGADQGQPLGYLQDGESAIIQGGPVWLQGESDTIVWWNVTTASGLTGWTPANTSELTLLVPAPQ